MRAISESVALAKHINTFLNEYTPLQKTRSACTLKSYYDAISLYLCFLETVKEICPEKLRGDCFCSENIEEWLLWILNTRNCSTDTCNNRLASIRAFLKYLGQKDITYLHLSQAASQIKRKKTTVKKVKNMSKNAITALLNAPDTSTKTGRRDVALMSVMYCTAARINEILSVKIEHLRLETQKPCITLLGKGSKIRTIYLTPNTVSHLKAYLKEFHGNLPNPFSYVFFSRNLDSMSKMSQTAVNKQLRKHATKAHLQCSDVPLDIHAHQIRHAKAGHWFDGGMNIVQISFLLGHAQLQTTMIYLDITTEQELKALETLEIENERSLPKKWHNQNVNLSDFCGVRQVKL